MSVDALLAMTYEEFINVRLTFKAIQLERKKALEKGSNGVAS